VAVVRALVTLVAARGRNVRYESMDMDEPSGGMLRGSTMKAMLIAPLERDGGGRERTQSEL
jgi:hypothetical protein